MGDYDMVGNGWWDALVGLGGRTVANNVDWDGTVTIFPHPNVIGSELGFTNYSGALGNERLHYPWGQYWTQAGPTMDEVYGGLWNDQELWNAQHRRYHPMQGRWTTPDPLGGDISNPQSLNRYAYVLNNPTTLTDPSGLGPPVPCTINGQPGLCTTVTASGGSIFFGGGSDAGGLPEIFHPGPGGGGSYSPPLNCGPLNNDCSVTISVAPPKPAPVVIAAHPPTAKRPPYECSGDAIFLNSFDLKVNLGVEVKTPIVKAGFTLFKNQTTSETGSELGLTVVGIGVEANHTVPKGGAINSGGPSDLSFAAGPVSYNPSTGHTSWSWGRFLGSWGGTLGAGLSVDFNPARYASQQAGCRTW